MALAAHESCRQRIFVRLREDALEQKQAVSLGERPPSLPLKAGFAPDCPLLKLPNLYSVSRWGESTGSPRPLPSAPSVFNQSLL